MKTVIISGGTGAIGRRLSLLLADEGYRVIILTRKKAPQPVRPHYAFSYWNPDTGETDSKVFAEADCIIHLAGANIAEKKWTAKRKQIITQSRLNSIATIAKGLKSASSKKPDIIIASAIGYYGYDQPEKVFHEDDHPGKGFLAEVCIQHEAAARELFHGHRLVMLRTGVVLDKHSGFYKAVAQSLKYRVAVIFGSGRQMVSWIHIHDLCQIYIFALKNTGMYGIYNACAPHPASLKEITVSMAKSHCGLSFIKISVPAFMLKLILGQLAEEALLGTAQVSAQKLIDLGFEFRYPSLNMAIEG